MGRLFNLDSPLMAFLSRVADLMILNIIVIVCCLPIITIGPSLTAMHYVLIKMVRKQEGYIVKPFFKSFRDNFKPALISWLIMLLFIVIFWIDLEILGNSGLEFAMWLRIALLVVGLIALMCALYVFPLIARFENTVRTTFKNAFYISILNLPKTILMIIVCVAPLVLVYIYMNLMPLLFLLGITAPGYVCVLLYNKIFKRFEPAPEEEEADSWTVPD